MRTQAIEGSQAVERDTMTLFPTVVHLSRLPNAAELNQRLMAEIKKIRASTANGRPESWASSVYTTLNTADQLHLLPEFAELTIAIMSEAEAFAETLRLDQQTYPLRITSCWFNIYGYKDGQERHNHPNSVFSGSYYVKVPPSSSGLMLHSPMHDTMFRPPLREVTPMTSPGAEIPVEEGIMVLFRSWVQHSVRPNPHRGERISISFNLTM